MSFRKKTKMNKGKIYLIPTTLGENSIFTIPEYVKTIIFSMDEFIVENEKSARQYLKAIGMKKPMHEIILNPLNKRTHEKDFEKYIANIFLGKSIGIISEAGCPSVADPGSEIVRIAHQKNIQVVPLIGPNSILLALMASGMNGQNFAFNGYLPIDKNERKNKLKELENKSLKENQTQIFMETPFRNRQILEDIISACQANTLLCLACDITLPTEFIQTKTIREWKNNLPDLHKRPAIFLIYKI